jgi:hypothetical protein
MTYAKAIKTLEKRAAHLAIRIQNSQKDLSYDKQELSALRIAIEVLEKQAPPVVA